MSKNLTTTAKKITVIPATKSLHPERDGMTPIRKKRVAAYCRVSTSLEEQQGSYELQKAYYESYIKSKSEWELVGIYGDEGKSGTSLRGRTGFLEMMDDVRAGKIDYIITKATSRFGRNNAEFIKILDELDFYNVEVLFESEGILNAGQQHRTMLQVIGATNEHYSSTLSNNVRWSKERNMKEGKVTICYKTFLGYAKGEDGEPVIVEEEAKIVRTIYELFLEGNTYAYIARYLTEHDIPTPAGKEIWRAHTVKSILTNEKYTGDAILQKTYKRSYLDKRAITNNGEKPKVIVENNHPAIIDKTTFARVQELVGKRAKQKDRGTSGSPFTGKIICADCKEYFGPKTWNSRGRIKYSAWVCRNKYTEETAYSANKCKSANLRQEWLESGYLYAINQLLAVRSDITAKYERRLKRINKRLESGEIKAELKALEKRTNEINHEMDELERNAEFTFGRQHEFSIKQSELGNQMAEVNNRIRALENEEQDLNANKKKLQTFMNTFTDLAVIQTRFSKKPFLNTIDYIEVTTRTLTYHFYGGEKVKVEIEKLRYSQIR